MLPVGFRDRFHRSDEKHEDRDFLIISTHCAALRLKTDFLKLFCDSKMGFAISVGPLEVILKVILIVAE